ncbi:AraC family transcriptional regulator [Geothrix limicola]|uniref:AraC family transcriptional regulator n=1 Tax=Geothrix limicola TaxID=2927978 RepID=A0ABQ5QCP5_9BACT|nr:helix-turn-helix domain-containing protein [Geothrix limicola]GLH71900.1 AraC family transcriptional regulator [Geothrix limicola]
MAKPTEWRPKGVVGAEAIRRESPAGRFLPEGPLAEFVEHFWTVSWDLSGQPSLVRETLPHPSVHLVIEEGRSGLAGVHTGRFSRRLEGRGWVLGTKFLPGCFRPFWGRPVSEFTDQVLPLATALGPPGAALEAAVLGCGEDASTAVTHVEAFLLERLPRPDAKARLARSIVARILEDRELTQAEAVAREAGLSLRSLQRLFQDYVGVSPKWVIQRYRLHEAMEQLEAHQAVDLPALALALGFFDQAHFIKAFRTYLGRTPAVYARGPEG